MGMAKPMPSIVAPVTVSPEYFSEARVAVAGTVDLQECNVAVLLIAEEPCRMLRSVKQCDGKLRAVLHDVIIRQDLAVSREENA